MARQRYLTTNYSSASTHNIRRMLLFRITLLRKLPGIKRNECTWRRKQAALITLLSYTAAATHSLRNPRDTLPWYRAAYTSNQCGQRKADTHRAATSTIAQNCMRGSPCHREMALYVTRTRTVGSSRTDRSLSWYDSSGESRARSSAIGRVNMYKCRGQLLCCIK